MSAFADANTSVQVVAVVGGTEAQVREFARDVSETVHVLPDPGMRTALRYRVGALPFAVAIDGSGLVRAKSIVNDRDGFLFLADAASANGDPHTMREEVEAR